MKFEVSSDATLILKVRYGRNSYLNFCLLTIRPKNIYLWNLILTAISITISISTTILTLLVLVLLFYYY